ncbi:MAG TPA: hypothetical protein ENJ60_13400 [Aeromonadales bacterium]|nr:hypothetical protein [Aeromonadales bacterium]
MLVLKRQDGEAIQILGLKEGKKKLSRSAKSSNSLPNYAQNLERAARQAKLLKSLGYISIALDSFHSGHKIYEACTTGREEECTITKYFEGARLAGSIGGGAMAGFAATYLSCTMVLGLETAGTSLLWCGLLIGGASAYLGGTYGGKSGENFGSFIYEVIEND